GAQLVYRIVDRGRLPIEDRLAALLVVVTDPEPPPLVLALVVQAQVDEDPIEPRRELRPSTKAPRHLVCRLLLEKKNDTRVVDVPEDGPGETIRSLLIARDEELEGRLVSPRHALTERFVPGLHSHG